MFIGSLPKDQFDQSCIYIRKASLAKMPETMTVAAIALVPWDFQPLIGLFLLIVKMPKEPRQVQLWLLALAFLPATL